MSTHFDMKIRLSVSPVRLPQRHPLPLVHYGTFDFYVNVRYKSDDEVAGVHLRSA